MMLLWALVLAFVLSMAWALVFQQGDWHVLAPTCFLALASSWACLIPGKLWSTVVDESWQRRAGADVDRSGRGAVGDLARRLSVAAAVG